MKPFLIFILLETILGTFYIHHFDVTYRLIMLLQDQIDVTNRVLVLEAQEIRLLKGMLAKGQH